MVADLSQEKGKIDGRFENSTSAVLQQCQNKVFLRRKGSGIVSNFHYMSLKGRDCSLMNRQYC